LTGSARPPRADRAIAGLGQLAGYTGAWFRADVLAGLTVTAYLVPQCLAYATLAGVPAVAGLWAAVVGMIAYALLGTSRQLSVGPESTTAIMVAAAVAPLAGADPARYATLAALLALMVGGLCIAAFVLRLGFVADLLSQPILVGYMAGVALIMIGSQLGTISGVNLGALSPLGRAEELVRRLPEIQPLPFAVGGIVIGVLLGLRRVAPGAPGALIAVAGAGAVVAILGLDRQGIALVGAVPTGLPGLSLPSLALSDVTALAGAAAAIALVGYTDVALTGRAFAARAGEAVDPDRELLALGGANVAAALTGGFPLSASGSRTAIVHAMRAHSQMSGIVAAGAVVVVMLLVPGLIARIPAAALGGVVIFAALQLIDVAEFRRFARFRLSEAGLAIAALGGVLLFDVLVGILVAVGLSVAVLFARVARPPAAVLGRVPGLAGLHSIADYPTADTIPGLLVFRYDALLCFANAEDFRMHALAAVNSQPTPVEWFLLNAEVIVELDVTAADALRNLATDLADRRITFAMARVKRGLYEQLRRGGLLDVIPDALIYPTLPVAVEAFEHRHDGLPRP
jgi:SulP family sulfate permease